MLSLSAQPHSGKQGRSWTIAIAILLLIGLAQPAAHAQKAGALDALRPKKPKPTPKPTPKPVTKSTPTKVVKTRPKPTPKPVAKATPKPTPTPIPVAKATPKPDPNARPLDPKPGALWKNPKDEGMLVFIPNGDFVMGSSDDDPDAGTHEKPRHTVKLNGFWMYRDLVTVGQFEKFCKATGRTMPDAPAFNEGWKNKDHPMVNVTWEEANAYCEWAGVKLPTEAQWEKAARGTDGRRYPWGNDFDAAKLWCSLQAVKDAGGTAPVHRPERVSESPFGIRDMAGNVWQWCADWWDEGYYQNAPAENPLGPTTPTGARVLRGGSWYNNSLTTFRTTNRLRASPQARDETRGFRAVIMEK